MEYPLERGWGPSLLQFLGNSSNLNGVVNTCTLPHQILAVRNMIPKLYPVITLANTLDEWALRFFCCRSSTLHIRVNTLHRRKRKSFSSIMIQTQTHIRKRPSELFEWNHRNFSRSTNRSCKINIFLFWPTMYTLFHKKCNLNKFKILKTKITSCCTVGSSLKVEL